MEICTQNISKISTTTTNTNSKRVRSFPLEKLNLGEFIAFGNRESEVYAEVLFTYKSSRGRPLIVYRILGHQTIGVLNVAKMSLRILDKKTAGLEDLEK